MKFSIRFAALLMLFVATTFVSFSCNACLFTKQVEDRIETISLLMVDFANVFTVNQLTTEQRRVFEEESFKILMVNDPITFETPDTPQNKSFWSWMRFLWPFLLVIYEVIARYIPALSNVTITTLLYSLFDLIKSNQTGTGKVLKLKKVSKS